MWSHAESLSACMHELTFASLTTRADDEVSRRTCRRKREKRLIRAHERGSLWRRVRSHRSGGRTFDASAAFVPGCKGQPRPCVHGSDCVSCPRTDRCSDGKDGRRVWPKSALVSPCAISLLYALALLMRAFWVLLCPKDVEELQCLRQFFGALGQTGAE